MKLIVVLSGVMIALLAIGPASAHRPYFTRVESIALPNGEMGELRLLHGDGIFWADPICVLALDSQSRLLARSHSSVAMALSCGWWTRRCLIFDGFDSLELDPSTFRIGTIVPGLKDEDRNSLWSFEAGDESWGFQVREASFVERVEGDFALAKRNPIGVTILIAIGAVVGFALRFRPSTSFNGFSGMLLFLFCWLVFAAFLFAVVLELVALEGLTFEVAAVSLVGGGAQAPSENCGAVWDGPRPQPQVPGRRRSSGRVDTKSNSPRVCVAG